MLVTNRAFSALRAGTIRAKHTNRLSLSVRHSEQNSNQTLAIIVAYGNETPGDKMKNLRKDPYAMNPEAFLSKEAKRKKKRTAGPDEYDRIFPIRFSKGVQRDFIQKFRNGKDVALRIGDDPRKLKRLHSLLVDEVKSALRGYMIRPEKNLVLFIATSIFNDPKFIKYIKR